MGATWPWKSPTPAAPPAPGPLPGLERPDLDAFVRTGDHPHLVFLRALVAVAAHDGDINPAEYDLLAHAAGAGAATALDVHAVLSAIDAPAPLAEALAALRSACAGAAEAERRALFNAAAPLLAVQGESARRMAEAFAEALRLALPAHELETYAAGPAAGVWDAMTRQSVRRLKGRHVLPVARESLRLTGDPETARLLCDYLDGKADLVDLSRQAEASLQHLAEGLDAFEQRLPEAAGAPADTAAQRADADRLYQQVRQRLAIVQARIEHEKAQFDDDLEECIHDAGNAVELEMAHRLKTDQWTVARVWESMGRSTFAKELERRVDRLARRHEKQLQLMKEDLRLFQEEFTLVRASVIERRHHGQLRPLMPALRRTTKAMNAIETSAEATLGLGVLAGLGTGGAIYAFGTAAVLPVIAPIAPFAGGALLVAGAVKWLMDSDDRKDKELAHKRAAFERALRERLQEMRGSYFAQLDTLAREFADSANALVRPVVLEAEAQARQAELQERVSRRVLANTRQAVLRLGHVPEV